MDRDRGRRHPAPARDGPVHRRRRAQAERAGWAAVNAAALPGTAFPLGATPGPGGTNFAVTSVADGVLLSLFDADGTETQVPLQERDGEVWHGFLPGVGPGQAYGYRATGPYDPRRGLRCNPAKLLLDPYARAIDGEVRFGPEVVGYAVDDPEAASTLDSAGHVPRSLVVDAPFDWSGRPRPRHTYADTVVYEVHVKGFTAAHPAVPEELRGTYAGLAHDAAVAHLVGLGVILDVVFNHTAEGGHLGPTLCHRGLHNPAYYRLDPADPRHYVDTTGTGNSLNAGSPVSLQMIMDSLRYWLTEMGVDGFRFDLAPTLARQEGGFDKLSAFFDLMSQDPVVSRAKLIAEPWDVGRADSYDLGRFPPLWSEWNGRYRDVVRDFWRSHDGLLGEFAARFSGSSDLYAAAGRRPTASVNLVTVHDGFTLADLVAYNSKHNQANGEANRDGTDDNRSWNCGAEGPTTEPAVLELRDRQRCALLTTLLLSFGVPMLLGGDELGRTQQGNNNAYCQDNPITWFDWSAPDQELLGFTSRLIAIRRAHPVFRRRRFLTGAEAAELAWYTPAAAQMTPADWNYPSARSVAVYLDGADAPDRAADGTPLTDDDFLLLVNAWWEPLDFLIPATRTDQRWEPEIDTYEPSGAAAPGTLVAGDHLTVRPRSIVLLHAPQQGTSPGHGG